MPVVVFFDGLDELAMPGKVGQEAAADFCDQLDRAIHRINGMVAGLQVVLGGREVEPVHVGQPSVSRGLQELLAADDRDLWWKTYGEVTGRVRRLA